jgi:hypothetical protein
MRTTTFKTVLFCVLSITILSCSKDDNNASGVDYVVDAESLMRNMSIPGSVLKDGEIPVPSGSHTDNIVSMPNTVIVTSNSFFTMPIVTNIADGRVPRMVFIKLEGSSKYYQIDYDANGNLVNSRNTNRLSAPIRPSCTGGNNVQLYAQGADTSSPYTNDAQVYVYSPPLQSSPLDPNIFSNFQNWSSPRTIKFKALAVGTGDVQVSLTWDTQSDIDLWLTEPNGNKIYYANKISTTGGELDFDNTIEYGPENIFYNNVAPSGTYKVQVKYYSGTPLTNYNVVVKKGNIINTYEGTFSSGQINDIVTFNK